VTVTDPRHVAADVDRPDRWNGVRRVWELPVPAHLAALALVLLALLPVIGTSSSFSADEGAAIIQARSLSEGDGWVVEHPLPEADPAGHHYPLELSERGPRGIAPFAKHPLYTLLLAGADRLGGVTAMVGLSLLGALAAAGLAAALAARMGPGLGRPAVWAVGLGSPLLFDGYLVMAHTLGAACAAAAALAAVVAFERRRPAAALAVAPFVAAAVLLRTEAVFFAAGLALAAGIAALRRRDRPVGAAIALSAVAATTLAHLGEDAWLRHLLGGPVEGTGAAAVRETSGVLAGRIDAFLITWLRPSYQAPPAANVLLLTMVVAVALAAFAVRRAPADRRRIRVLSGLAAVAAVLAVAVAPRNLVPGLLVACPLVLAGLLLVDRRTIAGPPARLAAISAGIFALGVLATQYETGGSGEWGGRYFALALPVAVPVLLVAVRRHGARLLAAGLVASSLGMAVMAVGGLRHTHRFSAGLTAAVAEAAATTGDGARPVVVTTAPSMPRTAWATFDDQRWLLATAADLGPLSERLHAAGIDRFTFVARSDADAARLPASVTREVARSYGAWRILVLRTA
jgi:hypothetical protein